MPTRPLRLDRKIDGFKVELHKRHGMLAILKKTLPSVPGLTNWEVVVIRVNPIHPMDEMGALEGWTHVESVPSSESWGTYGWTFTDLATAERRFNEVCTDYDRKLARNEIDDLSIDAEPELQECYDSEPKIEPKPHYDEEPEL